MSFLPPNHTHQILLAPDGNESHLFDNDGAAIVLSYDPKTIAEADSDARNVLDEVEEGQANGKTYHIPSLLELHEYVKRELAKESAEVIANESVLVKLLADVEQITPEAFIQTIHA